MNATVRPSIDTTYLGVLKGVMAKLGTLNGPAEQAFLGIGSVLGETSGLLGGIQGCFADLVQRLEGSEATTTANSLIKANAQIVSLAGDNQGSAEVLTQLADVGKRIDARLLALHKVVGEVGALAINAKIQVSLIASGGIDFTVFTTEIERLGVLARQTVDETSIRLHTLEQAINDALAVEQDFERNAARELASAQARLAEGLTILVDQHRAAATAVERVGLHSRDTAQRVVACMTELQFNDTACQRIEHVRDATATVIDLARSGTEDKIDALVGAVCRLQALQLSRTADEYQSRVDILIANLRAIQRDALNILTEADSAISSRQHPSHAGGQDSFIGTLERDIALAARLLTGQAAGQARVQAIVQSVSGGFSDMAQDLDAIHSIDSDMRIMGLNATFKCARLGNHGRALGVIAHELRACGKRTEEFTAQISDLLQRAIEISKSLGSNEGSHAALVADLGKSMTDSLVDLGALSAILDGALTKLHRDGDAVASLLTRTADGIIVHRHMHGALRQAAVELAGVADMTGADDSDIKAMGERIRTLLAGHYTMQSERLIHQIFADCFSEGQLAATKTSTATDDIDDLLF